jgi:hypothetical protein
VYRKFFPELERKFAISSWGFALYSPISILAFPVTVLVANPSASYLLLLACGLALTIATFLPYLLFIHFSSRLVHASEKTQGSFFLASSLLTGGVRGVIFHAIVAQLHLTQSGSLLNRIIASSFTTLIWLSASNLLVNYVRDFRYKYEIALKALLDRSLEYLEPGSPSAKSKSELKSIQDGLLSTLSALLQGPHSEDLQGIAASLTTKINLELRPLSKRIWVRSLGEFPVIRFRRLMYDSIQFLDFSHLWLISIMSALALLENIFIRGFQESLVRTFSYLMILQVVLFARKFKPIRNTVLFLLATGFIPILLGELIANALGYPGSWIAAILITPVAPAVIVVLSLSRLLQSDQNLIIELLGSIHSRKQDSSQINGSVADRELASFIHNSLQSEFVALAGQLSEAAKSSDEKQVESVKSKVSEILDRSFIEDFKNFTNAPLARLASVKESWKGLLEIEISIPETLLLHSDRNGLIVQTIEEFAANSFRHGKAKKVQVVGTQGQQGMKLLLKSDGQSPLSAQRGLGSEWLDQISVTPWTLESDTSGTLLTIEI